MEELEWTTVPFKHQKPKKINKRKTQAPNIKIIASKPKVAIQAPSPAEQRMFLFEDEKLIFLKK